MSSDAHMGQSKTLTHCTVSMLTDKIEMSRYFLVKTINSCSRLFWFVCRKLDASSKYVDWLQRWKHRCFQQSSSLTFYIKDKKSISWVPLCFFFQFVKTITVCKTNTEDINEVLKSSGSPRKWGYAVCCWAPAVLYSISAAHNELISKSTQSMDSLSIMLLGRFL